MTIDRRVSTGLVTFLCIGVVATASLVAAAGDGDAAGEKTTITLREKNRSGQSGTATLIERADGTFTVKIRMSKPVRFPGSRQNAHIHKVTCAKYARMKSFNAQLATVADWLTNVSRGRSTTHISVPLSKRMTGRFAINVHEQNPPYTVVACGNIPRAS
jgi:hypothetical protein